MIIGLDFDNTIVCYDRAIAVLAEQHLDLPAELPRTKVAIRDHLRSEGQEEAWTRFQGELYGPGMIHAELFEHALTSIRELAGDHHTLLVISHRTRFPYLGRRHDLHAFAKEWILERLPHSFESVTFHERKEEKLSAIGHLGCQIFVDDLPEILSDTFFPRSTLGVLFSPQGSLHSWSGPHISSWRDLPIVVRNRANLRR